MKYARSARSAAAVSAALVLAGLTGTAHAAAHVASWTVAHPPISALSSVPYAPLAGVNATSASDVWAVGRDDGSMLAEHWNGHAWSNAAFPSGPCDVFESNCYLTGVSGDTASDVIAVGNAVLNAGGWVPAALAYEWNGTAWSAMPLATSVTWTSLGHVKTFSANNAWAVGTGATGTASVATVSHWDGTSWTLQSTPFSTTLNLSMNAISGSSPNDVWAVGEVQSAGYHNHVAHSVILHYDGANWTQATIPDTGGLLDVSALSPTNAWALGAAGQVLHWDGTAWTIVTQFNGGTALSAVSATDVWVGGIYVNSALALAHYDGSVWTTSATPAGIDRVAGAAALPSGALWFAGYQWPPNGTTVPAVLSTTG